MWSRLDEQKRKLVAIAAMIAVLYIAYRFSFSHAIEAYQLNGRLKKEASLQLEDAAYPHLNKKHIFYQKVLAGYRVKKEEIDTKLWQEVSNMAVSQHVKISYDPSRTPLDTAADHKLHSLQFGFKGSYFNLVKLLDTLSKSGRVGKVSSLTIAQPKEQSLDRAKTMLEMQLILGSIDK